MLIGDRIKKLRNQKGISTHKLSKITGVSQPVISKLENGKRKADIPTVQKIADGLNVSLERLTGEAASSIIEDRIESFDMSLQELSEKAGVPLQFLQNLDRITPEPPDAEDYYKYMTQIAAVLELYPGVLRAALARQEIPCDDYDGPRSSVEEDFANIDFNEDTVSAEKPKALKPGLPLLTPKDEREIARDLEAMINALDSKSGMAAFNESDDQEDQELLKASLFTSMRLAKQIAKKKFTPKKFRKE